MKEFNERPQEVGKTFRELFAEAGVKSGRTKVDVAKDLGVSHAYIHQFIKGVRRPSFLVVENLREVLRMSDMEHYRLVSAYIDEKPNLKALRKWVESQST